MPAINVPEEMKAIVTERLAGEIARVVASEDRDSLAQKSPRLSRPKSRVSHLDSVLQAAVDVLPAPKRAPASWKKDRLPDETAPDFIKRHYKKWLGHGLHRAHIANLDPDLHYALRNFLRRHDMPDDLILPTIHEYNDQLVQALFGDANEVLDSPGNAEVLRKLFSAMSSRRQRRRNR